MTALAHGITGYGVPMAYGSFCAYGFAIIPPGWYGVEEFDALQLSYQQVDA